MKKLLFSFVLVLLSLSANADESGTCGDNLTWSYVEATQTLTISGCGEMSLPWGNIPWESLKENIHSVILQEGVTSIDLNAFCWCTNLTSVTIPNSVTSIGAMAFGYCWSLTALTIPNSVTTICQGAFFCCSGLTSLTIPKSVTSIGSRTFDSCGLTSIVVESGNTKYDSRDNSNAIIETATNTLIAGCKNTVIPNSVTSIGDGAFRDCYDLTSLTIPNSVTSIGDWAFSGCGYLTSVTIPNSVTSIGENAFYGCSSLTSVTIPNSVTNIGYGAFKDCSSLTSVTIPSSVTSIGEYNQEIKGETNVEIIPVSA